jgi:hypothetical protein
MGKRFEIFFMSLNDVLLLQPNFTINKLKTLFNKK